MNRLWPDVTHYAREFLKHNIEPNIQKSLPKKINNFSFETIDLGDKVFLATIFPEAFSQIYRHVFNALNYMIIVIALFTY